MFSDGEGGRRVSRYNADGTTTVVAQEFEGKRLNSPNDLAFDAQGTVVVHRPAVRRRNG